MRRNTARLMWISFFTVSISEFGSLDLVRRRSGCDRERCAGEQWQTALCMSTISFTIGSSTPGQSPQGAPDTERGNEAEEYRRQTPIDPSPPGTSESENEVPRPRRGRGF